MDRTFDRFGIALPTSRQSDELVAIAKRSEALGFDSFWLAETYHYRSAMPIAAVIGSKTTRLTIGLGIVPTHTRHPALIAMEAATLDELNGGRLILGLGSAARIAERHEQGDLVAAMREALMVTGSLLDGEEVALDGRVFRLRPTKLQVPTQRRIPIYVGTRAFSPRMLELTAQYADGVIYFGATTPDLIRLASEAIAEGAARAGRAPETIDVAAFLMISVDDDPARARAACKSLIATYTGHVHQVWLKGKVVTEEEVQPVLEALRRGGIEAGAKAVSDAMVDKLAIAGNEAYCRDRLREYRGTGLRLPIAYGVLGPDPLGALDAIARIAQVA